MADKIYIPPIKIQGIKTGIVPVIKENAAIDRDTVWVEPFMGSGVVGFNTAPPRAIFADINPHVIRFYNSIKNGTVNSRLVRSFLEEEGRLLSEKDGEYYYEVRERFNSRHDPLDFLFLNRSCFNGMIRFNKNGLFNVPYGHKPDRFAKAYVSKVVNQVRNIEYLLNNNDWSFICQSFEDTVSNAPENSFIYCDPPYIGRHVDYYDSWDEQSETALCSSLISSGAPFMLSTWDHNKYRANEYINKLWGFCFKVTKEHFYHVGAKETNRNPMVEALLMNYQPSDNCNALSRTAEQLSFFQ